MYGWIKIDRSILGHWIFEKPEYLKAWIAVLLIVNHAPNDVLIQGKVVSLERGQSARSLDSWGKLFGGWDKFRVKRFFDLLKKHNMICTEDATKTTKLTVVNYCKYQDNDTEERNEAATKSATKPQRSRNEAATKPHPNKNERTQEREECKEFSLFPDIANATPAAVASAIEKPAKKKAAPKDTDPLIEAKRATWKSYKAAYRIRYGEEPVSNAKQYSLIKQIVSRIPADEAPDVVAFYVNSHNSFYIGKGHSLQSFVYDCEKLRTEWATGRQSTQTQARQQDSTYTRVSNIVTAAIRSENEKRISSGSDNNGGNLQLESFSGSVESGH